MVLLLPEPSALLSDPFVSTNTAQSCVEFSGQSLSGVGNNALNSFEIEAFGVYFFVGRVPGKGELPYGESWFLFGRVSSLRVYYQTVILRYLVRFPTVFPRTHRKPFSCPDNGAGCDPFLGFACSSNPISDQPIKNKNQSAIAGVNGTYDDIPKLIALLPLTFSALCISLLPSRRGCFV